jgi:hypothetical protein
MNAKEIRKIKIASEFSKLDSDVPEVVAAVLLREIAAQLAELNENLRVKTSLDAGGGYPE